MYIYMHMHISMWNGRTNTSTVCRCVSCTECSTQNCWKYGKPTLRIQKPPEKFVWLMVEKSLGPRSYRGNPEIDLRTYRTLMCGLGSWTIQTIFVFFLSALYCRGNLYRVIGLSNRIVCDLNLSLHLFFIIKTIYTYNPYFSSMI